MRYIIPISDVSPQNISLVGRKSYGIKKLIDLGIPTITDGFVVSTDFTLEYLHQNGISPSHLNSNFSSSLENAVLNGEIPRQLYLQLEDAYSFFSRTPLAVRSSAILEDMPNASFGGQYRTSLNVKTFSQFCAAVKDCIASSYSSRALDYMLRQGLRPEESAMAVLVQPLVAAKSSGVVLTVHPASEAQNILHITASYGLGEAVVSNQVDPDTYSVLKTSGAVISRTLGTKRVASYALESGGIELEPMHTHGFCLSDLEISTLLQYGIKLEQNFGLGQDYEFVTTPHDEVIVTQVRPQILHGVDTLKYSRVRESGDNPILGIPVVSGAAHGILREYETRTGSDDVLYLESLDVSIIPSLRAAKGLVIDRLALGSHPALILREMGIPTITQPQKVLAPFLEQNVTLDATTGNLYAGTLAIETTEIDLKTISKPKTEVHIACSSTQALFHLRRLPLDGIALMRSEFIINYEIGIHPLALLAYDAGELKGTLRDEIHKRVETYGTGRNFFVEKLAGGVASIAALMPSKSAKYRFCDFQSNDYRGLLGGDLFEPQEENPMIGLRGVTRLLTPRFSSAFDLELEAIKTVRAMGMTNLELLFGFCRTPEDGEEVRKRVRTFGLAEITTGMMAEIPSNYLQADEFADVFDFFLVGPRDLTQTAYAADRTSPELAKYSPAGKAPMKAVMTLLRNLEGKGKDVFIGSYLLFQHLPTYLTVSSNNKLHFAELPDNIVDGMRKLTELEERL